MTRPQKGWHGKPLILLVLLSASMAVPRVHAANLNATPSLSLGASWDSNINNSSTGEEEDYVFRATPRLSFTLESPTTKAEIAGAVEGEKYAKHDELDNADATKSVDFRLVRTGPRLTLSPSARFVDTEDLTRRTLLDTSETPVPGIPPAELLFTERVRTKIYSGALRMSYLLTPNLTLGIGGGGSRQEYSGNSSGLTDSKALTGNASFAYRFTPRFSSGLSFSTGYNSFEGRPNSRTYSAEATGTYRMTEHTTLGLSAGATMLRESTGVGDEKEDEWSPTGSLSLGYARDDFRATLLGSYGFSGGGSFGQTTKRESISLSLSDTFLRSWSWNLGGVFQKNRSTGNVGLAEEDTDAASGTAGLRYRASSWASFRLSGNVYKQRSDTALTGDVDRETVLLDLTLGNTFNLF